MNRTLDYSAIWADTVSLLKVHKEALIAIAGVLIFLPNWISAFFAGQPDVEGLTKAADIYAAQSAYFMDNWLLLLTSGVIAMYGGFALYALILRKDMPRVGDALLFALKLFPFYFIAALLVGLFTLMGLLAFIIGALYLSGRFLPFAATMISEPVHGIMGSIKRSWELTRGAGWMTFLLALIVSLVLVVIILVTDLIIGLICTLMAGPEGIPLVQTGFSSLTATIATLVGAALGAAIYRHLVAQDKNVMT
jgi:hypothetical protein